MNPDYYVNPWLLRTIAVSCFFAIANGLIFKDMLEYQVTQWYTNRKQQDRIFYQKPGIVFTYVNITTFLFIFVGASLSVFGFFDLLAYSTAAVVVFPTALLIWLQLGSMLKLLVSGGSEAIDIDSYGAGQIYDPQTKN
ncbi:MAG: hypothetical protein SAJ37_16720 [Oscillatoria sp. PMC 1068.18]|nr:hypothetical protein [Oscillatoria sp. PMC 1076.18]MEC4990376.1 hypothetical protein [Oscillatoria sp. PMC 1068.18]